MMCWDTGNQCSFTKHRCNSVVLPGPSRNPSSMILDETGLVEGGSWQPIQQRIAVVQPAAYEGVHQCLCGLLGEHPANCIDVADVHVRGTADLVDVSLHILPAVPQHSRVTCHRSDREVGSRNAKSSSKDVVVLTGELDDDGFFLIHHEFVCNRPAIIPCTPTFHMLLQSQET